MRNEFLEPEKGTGMVGWAVRQAVFWLIGGLAVYAVAAHSGRLMPSQETEKPVVSAAPARRQPAVTVRNSLTLRAGHDGHVYVDAAVNGAPVNMVVDTGATDVVLTLADAAKAGLSPGQLSFSGRSSTANGVTRFAPVTLREVRIGQLEIGDVRAAVVEHLGVSLLGQSFLRRLDSYEMRGGVLTLNWR